MIEPGEEYFRQREQQKQRLRGRKEHGLFKVQECN